MKKHIVRLTDEESKLYEGTINRPKSSSQKASRTRTLLQVDADWPDWTGRQVAEAFRCRA